MALTYPQNLSDLIDDGAGGIQFSFLGRPDSQTSNMGQVVQLYLPNNLRNPMDVNWEQKENGLATAKFLDESGATSGDSWLGMMANVGMKIADFANATSAIEQKTGTIANPYMAMTFKSLGFRKFQMEFRFTPHNKQESWDIDEIITEFRRCALPTGGAMMGYPDEVMINYLGKCMTWLPMFKPCVITALDVNYAGQGFYAGMQDGFPAETILTLEFTENVLVYREDVHQGVSY